MPLSDPALTILATVPERKVQGISDGGGGKRELLFGRLDGAFSGWSRCKARLDQRILTARLRAAGIDPESATEERTKAHRPAPWVLHDLRRTAVTGMAELGVQPHVIEAVVNHVSGHKAGIAGIYNRATYAREKRQALELWGHHVQALAAGEPTKVVPLRPAVPA